jgi:hypothetical protein
MCAIALLLGYVWIRAMHYPLTLRQRKMWTYYVLFICSLPVLGEIFLAMKFWVMPLQQSGVLTIILLIIWMIVAFFIVRRMSKPGGHLSEERHEMR